MAVSTELFTLSSKTRIDMIDIIDMMCLLLLPQESQQSRRTEIPAECLS